MRRRKERRFILASGLGDWEVYDDGAREKTELLFTMKENGIARKLISIQKGVEHQRQLIVTHNKIIKPI